MVINPALILTCIASFSSPEGLVPLLTPAQTSIFVGDCLLVQSALKNNTKQPASLERPLSSAWGGVHYEVAKPGRSDFQDVIAIGEGWLCGLPPKVTIAPATRTVGYSMLMWQNGPESEPIFNKKGEWQIRMSVRVGRETVVSRPVVVNVVASPHEFVAALKKHHIAVVRCLADRTSLGTEELDELLKARPAFGASGVGREIDQVAALRELRYANAPQARRAAKEQTQKVRGELSGVELDHYDLITVGMLIDRKEYKDAQVILNRISVSSIEVERRRALITDQLGADKK